MGVPVGQISWSRTHTHLRKKLDKLTMLSKIAFVIGLMVGHALAESQVLDYDITETTYFNQDAQPAAITTVEGQGFFSPESRVNFDNSQFYYEDAIYPRQNEPFRILAFNSDDDLDHDLMMILKSILKLLTLTVFS